MDHGSRTKVFKMWNMPTFCNSLLANRHFKPNALDMMTDVVKLQDWQNILAYRMMGLSIPDYEVSIEQILYELSIFAGIKRIIWS